MSQLIEVEFKGNRKEFFLWDHDELPPIKAGVIVDADRGEDLGRVHATGAFAQKRYAGVPHGAVTGPVEKHALRLATVDDMRRASETDVQNDDARRRAVRHARVALLGERAGGVHAAEVLAPVGVDDDPRLDRRQVLAVPQEELLPVSVEGDFDELGHEGQRLADSV
jgi:hypothetical protein